MAISTSDYKKAEEKFLQAVDKALVSVEKKFDSLTPKVIPFSGTILTLQDNTVYVYNGKTGVQDLTIDYPAENFIATILFSTASSGKITVEFKSGTQFVGSAPYEFFPGENWELNIHNGRVAGSQLF